MSLGFVNLPAPAANGAGAAVDVSGLAPLRTIVNGGNGSGQGHEPMVVIEVASDVAGTRWTPLTAFQQPGNQTLACGARWMRAVVSNYAGGGAPEVNVGAEPAIGGGSNFVYADMHFLDAATPTVVAVPGTFVKASNASELRLASSEITMPVNNRMLYTGNASIVALLIAAMSFTCSVNNQVLRFAFFINGIQNVPSFVRTKISTGADVQAVTMLTQIELASGDYVEVYLTDDTGASSVTIEHGNICLRG